MRTLRVFCLRLAGAFRKARAERELQEEFALHLQMQIDDNLRAGMPLEEARRQALLHSGGVETAKEAVRDRRGLPLLETLAQDLRYAARMIRKSPGFTAVVALTLALGIGANTAIFSVIHAALAPLPIPQPDRAVMVWTENPQRDWHQFPSSVPDYLDWKSSGAFSSLGLFEEAGFNLRFGDRTERIDGVRVNPGAFEVLGTQPFLGRVFRAGDVQPGHSQVVVLTHHLWRSRFAGDPAIVGKTVVLDGAPHTIVGVFPKPTLGHEEIYVPLVLAPPRSTDRGSRGYSVLGRLASGMSLDAAQQRVSALAQRLARQYPRTNAGVTVRLQFFEEAYVEDARLLLQVLLGAVGFVLLIACANIANLLLARGASRDREMAIRAALGAGRWRLCRQLLVENVLLALIGGAVALLPAVWGIQFIVSFHLDELPNAELISLNPGVLAFHFVLALLTGILFGLVPAWQVRATDVNTTLKASARQGTDVRHQRLRGVFVMSEVALTLVLLTGAALLVRSFLRFRAADPGYRASGVLTMRVALSDVQYATPAKQLAFFEQVVERARALPGVEAAAATEELPTSDNIHGSGLHFPDRAEARPEDIPIVLHNAVTSDYFRAMLIPLRRNRWFDSSDRSGSPPVALVDEWTARRYWPGQDPVGSA